MLHNELVLVRMDCDATVRHSTSAYQCNRMSVPWSDGTSNFEVAQYDGRNNGMTSGSCGRVCECGL
ncbi:hypothetical protein PC128_g9802 [Phytophthora cactorum]|nr:hypothetical protein PC120_g4069 [Phytophthora cactorum]KAG3193940.1 hypothetical protein PC128_g9802 [Phytophthora cactorum]